MVEHLLAKQKAEGSSPFSRSTSMIYPYSQIRAVHLEVTDRCNAACPMCARYDHRTGRESTYIQNTVLSLDDIKTIMPVEFLQQIRRVNFCGNYGDPIVHRDLIGIIGYLIQCNPDMRIEVNTNGSARTKEWWTNLAHVIGSDERMGGVWFGIDGLGVVNELYRRNTNWTTIMRNARTFIEAGGVAHWNFIAFEHNEHQVEAARQMAQDMGFRHFNVKLTGRFKDKDSFPVIVDDRQVYELKPAAEERHTRPNPGTDSIPVATKPTIECVAQKESCIYVNARGEVYPCCWLANAVDVGDKNLPFDPETINAKVHPLREIVEGAQFQAVEDSWSTGSIRKCVQFCGVNKSDDKLKHGPDYVIHETLT